MKARRSPGKIDPDCRSRRAVLMRWIDSGGPLPARLAEHTTTCGACRGRVSRIARVHAGLTMLLTQTAPVDILARANEKAMRMLARQLRESRRALRLRRAKPPVGLWPKIEGPLARATGAAAAAMIILSLRAGVEGSVRQTYDLLQPLSELHYQRHIDDQEMLSC